MRRGERHLKDYTSRKQLGILENKLARNPPHIDPQHVSTMWEEQPATHSLQRVCAPREPGSHKSYRGCRPFTAWLFQYVGLREERGQAHHILDKRCLFTILIHNYLLSLSFHQHQAKTNLLPRDFVTLGL